MLDEWVLEKIERLKGDVNEWEEEVLDYIVGLRVLGLREVF